MTPEKIISICKQVDNLMCCVFSSGSRDNTTEFTRFAHIASNESISHSAKKITFGNGSEIRFIICQGDVDLYENIAGLEIGLAIMNRVPITMYLKTRMRFTRGVESNDFRFPRIVELEVREND